MIYILNTLVVPVDFDKHSQVTVKLTRISLEEAKALISSQPFVSAVGHEGTAKLLTKLFGVEVPLNRINARFEVGDVGIHFFLKQRLPEGTILTEDQLKKLDFWLVKSEVF
jgi:hypothetical protein